LIGRTDGKRLCLRFQLVEKLVVDGLIDDGPGACRALLSLISESGIENACDRLVQVALAIDDNCILAAHLGDHALNPALAPRCFRGEFIDMKSDIARASE